jgi:hypothetical protein
MKRKNNEAKIRQEIIESQNAIRMKYKKLKSDKIDSDSVFKNTFETISTPLNKIVELKKLSNEEKQFKTFNTKQQDDDMEYSDSDEDSKSNNDSEVEYAFASPTKEKPVPAQVIPNNKGEVARQYFLLHLNKEKQDLLDKVYGIRSDGKHWLLGNSVININDEKVIVANKTYKTTPGLLELLFMKTPSDKKYTQDDLKIYKEMILDTNGHKQHYESSKQINSNRGFKYMNIIRNLFMTHGQGMSTHSPIYERWNDPNELVDRLKLLIASQSAGNSSVGNEIISIIEELREENIIV